MKLSKHPIIHSFPPTKETRNTLIANDHVLTFAHRLAPITSQHALTTQNINFYPDGKTASAMTYFTATHFGKGKWQGHVLTAHGKYIDELVRTAPGQWRVKRRVTRFMGPRIGEPRIMEQGPPTHEMAG